jgi:hypothetical protein
MDEQYHVKVTSRDSAEVDDIPLTPPQEDKLTRRIIRPSIVNNANEAAASVRLHLIHQKRHKKNEPWEDAEKFNIATLKSGEEVRFALDSTETWRLKETLNQLYAIGRNGVPHQSNDFVAVPTQEIAGSLIVKGSPKEMLEKLYEQYGDELWKALDELQPDLLESITLHRLNEKRRRIVQKFRRILEGEPIKEHHWQKFFADNLWIFGHNLDYRVLPPLQESEVEAHTNFTVWVNVNTPQTPLLESETFNAATYQISSHVSGGIAQLQLHSEHEANSKSILVIGNLNQLDTERKRTSFELFRRNLHNPEILTFDEILARAEWIVGIRADESVAP